MREPHHDMKGYCNDCEKSFGGPKVRNIRGQWHFIESKLPLPWYLTRRSTKVKYFSFLCSDIHVIFFQKVILIPSKLTRDKVTNKKQETDSDLVEMKMLGHSVAAVYLTRMQRMRTLSRDNHYQDLGVIIIQGAPPPLQKKKERHTFHNMWMQ